MTKRVKECNSIIIRFYSNVEYINTPSVKGSFRNTSKQSVKLVPLKGSPPIPTD